MWQAEELFRRGAPTSSFYIEVVDGDPRYGVALDQEESSYLDRSEWQKQFHLRLAKTIATIIVKRGSENK